MYSDNGVLLHKKKFVHDLLLEFYSFGCSYVVSPLEMHETLKVDCGDPLPNPGTYKCLVGKLNFVTHTRLDIYFAAQHLSKFMQKPCIPHMQAALRLLLYLKGTPDLGIFYNSSYLS